MPEVKIRPATTKDFSDLTAMDHSCLSEYVWQMDFQREDERIGVYFRETRLPRSITVRYPRPVSRLSDGWGQGYMILVAEVPGLVIGYIRMTNQLVPQTTWITDLAISSHLRRQGIASRLVLEAHTWALEHESERVIMETSSKNCAAIRLAQKHGYEFCGYNDHYYETKDIALFFGRTLR